MRLLITGGAGCLGANIIDHFLPRAGVEILVLDNFCHWLSAIIAAGHQQFEHC